MHDGSMAIAGGDEAIEYAWFVNRPTEVADDDFEQWLASGLWQSPSPEAHADTLAEVQVGDRIACKSVSTRRTGLPFFTGDKPASVMLIHAIGTVTSVDPEAGRLGVTWQPLPEPRAWYFYTAVRSVWRVGNTREFSRALLDFTGSSRFVVNGLL